MTMHRTLDDACTILRTAARSTGADTVVLLVRQDGRVMISGESGGFLKWSVRGDVAEGGALPLPSVALDFVKSSPTGASK